MNPDFPLAPKPFALSLSKGRSWFDKLTTNGFTENSPCAPDSPGAMDNLG